MKRWFVYGVALSIMAVSGGGAYAWWAQEQQNQCFDVTRMADLFVIAQMVEDYEEEAGRYPFQSTDDTVTKAMLTARDLTAVEATTALDKQAFYDELERILGQGKVERLTDPQTDAQYTYRAQRDAYYLSATLTKAVPQSIETTTGQHIIQLSSVYDAEQKIFPYLQVPVDSILEVNRDVAARCG